MDIVQIIEGCKRKETRCQKILYERFFGCALKIAFRYVYQYDSAVNVTNDGFVKLFRHIEKFNYKEDDFPEQQLMSWIKRIIVKTSIDELRRNKMTPEIVDIPENVWEEVSENQDADQSILYKKLITHVKNLPPIHRIVFNMFVIDGFTHFNIANTLDISVAASELNLSCARGIIQKIINGHQPGETRLSG